MWSGLVNPRIYPFSWWSDSLRSAWIKNSDKEFIVIFNILQANFLTLLNKVNFLFDIFIIFFTIIIFV
jgi:hypothetical protein